MDTPLFLDLSHTSHTRARTGVQRVARAIHRELAGRGAAVCYDPHEGAWRPLEPWEEANLAAVDPAPARGSRWPLAARLRGRLRRIARRPPVLPSGSGGVIVPEIFSSGVARALPRLFASSPGPRVAVFHDAVALQFPEHAPRSTSARFPSYMLELLRFDGVAAVSEASRDSLLEYWAWLGISKAPPVVAISLGIDAPAAMPAPAPPAAVPTVLCVGSIEGRKNHLALLDACESLWAREAVFALRLVGMASQETGGAALSRIEQLRSLGRPIHYGGPASDAELDRAYRACAFTVYPSVAEGFGLPVAESLARGKACLCRMDGATGEIARGGGCLSIGEAGAAEIAGAIGVMLAAPFDLATLEAEARARRLKRWPQYAAELLGWMGTLTRNA